MVHISHFSVCCKSSGFNASFKRETILGVSDLGTVSVTYRKRFEALKITYVSQSHKRFELRYSCSYWKAASFVFCTLNRITIILDHEGGIAVVRVTALFNTKRELVDKSMIREASSVHPSIECNIFEDTFIERTLLLNFDSRSPRLLCL